MAYQTYAIGIVLVVFAGMVAMASVLLVIEILLRIFFKKYARINGKIRKGFFR